MDPVVIASCAALGAAGGLLVPTLVRRIPEPVPAAVPGEADAFAPDPEKIPYADLAAAPGLGWKAALAGALTAGVIGAATGWAWALLFLVPLVPVGVALAYVDHRTRLLPTKVIAPTYVGLLVLVPVAALLDGDPGALVRAGLGWLVAGGMFWLLWRLTPGLGYGDVRLSGVLGIALGYLGWGELLLGLYGGFLLGSLGWVPLRLLRITTDRNFPFGPFMLLGAVAGIVWGADVAAYLAGRQG